MDMRDLVEAFLGPPQRRGPNWSWYLCPLKQEKDASFGVQSDHAHCYSCGFHSGPTWFLRKVVGWDKERALQYVDQGLYRAVKRVDKGIELPPLPPSKEWQDRVGPLVNRCCVDLALAVGREGRKELLSRGIIKSVWEQYEVGWNKKSFQFLEWDTYLASGLVFPLYVDSLWSVNVRTKSGIPKYCRVKGDSHAPYGIGQLQGHDTIVICEGEPDLLTVVSQVSGVDVLALRGVGNGIQEWNDYLWQYQNGFIVLDGDDPGRLAAEMLQYHYPDWINREPPEGLDVGKMYKEGFDIEEFIQEGYSL